MPPRIFYFAGQAFQYNPHLPTHKDGNPGFKTKLCARHGPCDPQICTFVHFSECIPVQLSHTDTYQHRYPKKDKEPQDINYQQLFDKLDALEQKFDLLSGKIDLLFHSNKDTIQTTDQPTSSKWGDQVP